MLDPIDTHSHAPRQRSARNDPAMRDGDSAHGSPYEAAGDEESLDSDSDVGDTAAAAEGLRVTAGRNTSSVDPDALDRLADGHAGPEAEAEYEEEEETEAAADANLPIAGYEGLTVAAVAEQAAGLAADDLRRVLDYELAHRHRKTLVAKLTKMTGDAAPTQE